MKLIKNKMKKMMTLMLFSQISLTLPTQAQDKDPEYLKSGPGLKQGFGLVTDANIMQRVIIDPEELLLHRQTHEQLTLSNTNRIGRAEGEIRRVKARATRLENRVDQHDQDIYSLNSRTGVLELRADGSDRRHDRTEYNVGVLQGDVGTLQGQVRNHEWRLGSVESTVGEHSRTLRTHGYQIGSLQRDSSYLSYSIGQVQNQASQIDYKLRQGYYGGIPERCRNVTVRRQTDLVDSIAFTRTPVLTGLLPGNAKIDLLAQTRFVSTFSKTGLLNVQVTYNDRDGTEHKKSGFVKAEDVLTACQF